MFVHNLNPTLLNLGPLEVRWYGLVYVLGFLLSIWWLLRLSKQNKLDLSKEEVWDFVFYIMLGVIVGARLFQVFWEPHYYLSNPLRLLKIWEGGMSFHGGFVGIITATWFYCKKKRLNFWRVADLLSIPAIFALALGRIANFINGELAGRITNVKWCVVFTIDDQCRHPSTLYAAGKRFLVFGWLLFLHFKSNFQPGFIFWNFVFWEGLGRIMVDLFRENQVWLGFSLGQWFSLAMVIVASYVFWKKYKKDWKKIISS